MSTTEAPAGTVSEVRERAEGHLRALVGREYAVLREDQWTAIEALAVQRRRALVVQRTGWGKSAVYFVATLLLREAGAGPTVIVSPLLALMRNQIAAAERAGIRAATVNSTNLEEWDTVHAAVAAGEIDVLLVSPERLNNPGFRDEVLPRLAATCGLLVVDEAHCISDWGHDFRPDYRRIRTLLGDLPEGIPVLATTATANARVTSDVAEQLGSDGVTVLRGSLDRESLRLAVVRLRTAEQRLAWLADHLAEQPGSGIVYCLTVAATQEVAAYLRERGHDVAAYSGQTEATERQALEQQLAAGEVKALVATSALGMGFDATLGFVVNLGAPSSPVAYYQQVGRAGRGLAGRGLDEATVVLLPQIEDRDIWAYFASLAFPREALVRQTLAELEADGGVLSTAVLETRVELSRNRLETMLKVLDVDGAVQRVRGGWRATGREWAYDEERYARVAEAREREQAAMLEYLGLADEVGPGDGGRARCRMRFLREQLDDPDAEDCGRCDTCGGFTPSVAVSEEAVAGARERLARPGVVVEPRKMWPTGLARFGLDHRGRIGAGASPGRAVARLTDLGHGQALRELFAGGGGAEGGSGDGAGSGVGLGDGSGGGPGDGPVPVPLARAVVAVLDDWPELDGLTGIVVVESVSRPALVRDLADGLARYLRVPVVARWAIADPSVQPGQGAMNSAQRVAAVARRYRLDAPDGVRGKVVVVDDRTDTGWTLTLAATALREAGATEVLPLVLATTS